MDEMKVALAGSFYWTIGCPDYGKVGQGNMRTSSQIDKETFDYRDRYSYFHLTLVKWPNGFDMIGRRSPDGRSFKQGCWLIFEKLWRYTMTHKVTFILRRFSK